MLTDRTLKKKIEGQKKRGARTRLPVTVKKTEETWATERWCALLTKVRPIYPEWSSEQSV
jgi:hypothetical protein